ncbi:hypothetical protein J1C56_01815 [Aminobacter anthyllidis]|uniref:Uncharacterized protein n=1 Tax=Aminobacter anthyllidis TaxID=1035067 RepID=A0A9X1D3W6_9HYPH|nr:hypothetical protein [Aminobacter anthyllidis]MBT1154321.1 hypothetical protein [Aminobacter anthyllidis]
MNGPNATAISAAFERHGIVGRDVRLQLAFAEFQNNGGEYGVALAMLNAAFGKGSGGQNSIADDGLAGYAAASRLDDGEDGLPCSADEATLPLPSSPSPKRHGAGHSFRANKAILPAPRPVSASYLKAAKSGAKQIALTVLDSFRVRDGRAIGDVPWSSLDRLISEGGREIAVLKMIRNKGVPPDHNSPIRLYVGVQELERIIQKAAELTDAA